MNLANQVVLVTGASRGIGRAIATELGKQGATVVGTATSESGIRIACQRNSVQPRFLELLGIPILEGRAINAQDIDGAPKVVVVDQTPAQALWPGHSALGQIVTRENGGHFTVVGVCAPFRFQDPSKPPQPLILLSHRQTGQVLCSLLVRSPLPEAALRRWLELETAAVEPRLALHRAEPLRARLERHLQALHLGAALMGTLSVLALVLAAAGTYGLQSLLATQRRREQALRAALGATPSRQLMEAIVGTLLPAMLGLTSGLALSWALRRALSAMLGPLGHISTEMLLLAALFLFLTALCAALLPALREAKRNPGATLRSE